MIILFTDFGIGSPYLGQMKAVLLKASPTIAMVDLHADAPRFDPLSAAYLLAAYHNEFEPGTIWLCVVDPGVGSLRLPIVVRIGQQYYVGPDNGLFHVLAVLYPADCQAWEIVWHPPKLSHTFHGRDLFAPIASRLAVGDFSALKPLPDWPHQQPLPACDAPLIIYQDTYGNLFTGLRAKTLSTQVILNSNAHSIAYARTYSEVPLGSLLWYENAIGLVEIGRNQGSAAEYLGVHIGDTIQITKILSHS